MGALRGAPHDEDPSCISAGRCFVPHGGRANGRCCARALPRRLQVPAGLQVRRGAVRFHQVTLEPTSRNWILTLDATPECAPVAPGRDLRMTPPLQWTSPRPVTELTPLQRAATRHSATGRLTLPRRCRTMGFPGFNPRTMQCSPDGTPRHPREVGPERLPVAIAVLERRRTGGYGCAAGAGRGTAIRTADEVTGRAAGRASASTSRRHFVVTGCSSVRHSGAYRDRLHQAAGSAVGDFWSRRDAHTAQFRSAING